MSKENLEQFCEYLLEECQSGTSVSNLIDKISKLIDQIREETIIECETVSPDELLMVCVSLGVHTLDFKQGYNQAVKDQKKSLINLRQK